MDFIFHRRIQKDLRSALVFYEDEGGAKLGDRFFSEAEQATQLRRCDQVGGSPTGPPCTQNLKVTPFTEGRSGSSPK